MELEQPLVQQQVKPKHLQDGHLMEVQVQQNMDQAVVQLQPHGVMQI